MLHDFKITAKSATFDAFSFELKHASDYDKSQSLPIEIDSEYDFGTFFYRVWIGERNIGTFRRQGEKWLAYPFYNNPDNERTLHKDADAARDAIVNSYLEGVS